MLPDQCFLAAVLMSLESHSLEPAQALCQGKVPQTRLQKQKKRHELISSMTDLTDKVCTSNTVYLLALKAFKVSQNNVTRILEDALAR